MELYNLSEEEATTRLNILYRYSHWNTYTIDVITNRHLYLATANQMNDKWEFRISYVHHNDLVGSIDDMFPGGNPTFIEGNNVVKEPFQDQNPILQEADLQTINSDRENVGIACFTNCNNNPMMWYHYADCYRGVCLEFTSIFDKNKETVDGTVGAVSYGDYPYIDIVNQARSNNSQGIDPMYRYFYKSITWEQENEIRYIRPMGCERSRYLPFDDTVLTAIYCGFRMSESDIKLVYDLAMLNNRCVKVYTSVINENGFGFSFNKYEP